MQIKLVIFALHAAGAAGSVRFAKVIKEKVTVAVAPTEPADVTSEVTAAPTEPADVTSEVTAAPTEPADVTSEVTAEPTEPVDIPSENVEIPEPPMVSLLFYQV